MEKGGPEPAYGRYSSRRECGGLARRGGLSVERERVRDEKKVQESCE